MLQTLPDTMTHTSIKNPCLITDILLYWPFLLRRIFTMRRTDHKNGFCEWSEQTKACTYTSRSIFVTCILVYFIFLYTFFADCCHFMEESFWSLLRIKTTSALVRLVTGLMESTQLIHVISIGGPIYFTLITLLTTAGTKWWDWFCLSKLLFL